MTLLKCTQNMQQLWNTCTCATKIRISTPSQSRTDITVMCSALMTFQSLHLQHNVGNASLPECWPVGSALQCGHPSTPCTWAVICLVPPCSTKVSVWVLALCICVCPSMQDNLQSFEMELMSSLSGVAGAGKTLSKRLNASPLTREENHRLLLLGGHMLNQIDLRRGDLDTYIHSSLKFSKPRHEFNRAEGAVLKPCRCNIKDFVEHLWVISESESEINDSKFELALQIPAYLCFMFCPSISIISFETWIILNSTAPIGALRSTEAQQVSQTLGRCPCLIWGSRAKWIKANFRPSGLMSSLSVQGTVSTVVKWGDLYVHVYIYI